MTVTYKYWITVRYTLLKYHTYRFLQHTSLNCLLPYTTSIDTIPHLKSIKSQTNYKLSLAKKSFMLPTYVYSYSPTNIFPAFNPVVKVVVQAEGAAVPLLTPSTQVFSDVAEPPGVVRL